MDLLKEFKIRSKSLQEKKRPFLLALSGGMDSMCLADLCTKTDIPFEVAHCNFGLRGDESNGDESFVREFCDEHGLKLRLKRFDLIEQSNIQEQARDLRYDWFYTLIEAQGLAGILTAHHADDQLETFFINLLRGSGMKGLAGMKLKGTKIFRPLLFARRTDIEEYVEQKKIQFRTDSSNASDKYLRNMIRHKLVPLVEEMRSGSSDAMLKSIENIRAQMKDLESYYRSLEIKYVTRSETEIRINRSGLDKTGSGFLEFLLAPLGFSRDAFIKIAVLEDESTGKQFRSATHLLTFDRDELIVSIISFSDHAEIQINENDLSIMEPIGLEFQVLSEREPITSGGSEQFDLELIEYPLTVRKWKEGDRFVPLGMNGSKLISDQLIDIKMPRNKKDEIFVLCSGDNIMWVIGVRISNEFKLNDSTKAVLKIKML